MSLNQEVEFEVYKVTAGWVAHHVYEVPNSPRNVCETMQVRYCRTKKQAIKKLRKKLKERIKADTPPTKEVVKVRI